MKLAQVIVDVPTMQTDVPFTYSIPQSLLDRIKPGMRVIVPFGNGGRKIQGFVIGFTDHSKYRLKPISAVMDLTPVVDDELLQLSKWLAKTTFSFRISCLQTMLPSVMKAKYAKRATLLKPINDPKVKQLFDHQASLTYRPNKLTPDQQALIYQLRQRGLIKVTYLVKNQARSEMVNAFTSRLPVARIKYLLKAISTRNVGQVTLLRFLLEHPTGTYKIAEVTKYRQHLSSSVINQAAKKGWLKKLKVRKYRNPYKQPVKKNHPFKLNSDQWHAVNQIDSSIVNDQFAVYLLEGVTGSGKTEVYLQAISKALQQGKTALMLVPEISLTPQMVTWVKGRFGDLVAILHSGLSSGEKYDEWQRIQSGNAKVVVGARSAIFAPLKNLGIIIMDEEHDTSYKQEDTPRYQTRSVAKWRGKYYHCPVVLGSATPSLESRARATKHVYHLLRLPHRINHQALPTVHIVDMRKEIMKHHGINYSSALLDAIKLRLKRHEQVVLMLNRRGYSNFVMCRNCGYVPKCPNCDISLTFHWHSHSLRCHYCGHEEPIPRTCPKCGSRKIRYLGTGTEQAELELKRFIPGIKIVRMDVDTTSRKGAHVRLLHEFGSGYANVLLGTQMIAKGLDFPNVTLVGVLNADTSLMLPDFRSEERTFQLLTQVSGRAGRAKKKGEVFIQTFNPDNYAIRLAQQQNYERFYLIEMTRRHALNYPPYYYSVRLTASSKNRRLAIASMASIKQYLQTRLSPQTIILGPAPSAITRIKQRYYFQMVIKYKHEPNLQETLDYILNHYQIGVRNGLFISIDPNPVNFM